jgi:hypothetical protein
MSTVKCVQVSVRLAKDGNPTPTGVKTVLRCSGTDYPHSATLSPGTTFARSDQIWELNPADSAAFEDADLDGMEVGIKAVA